MARSIDLSSLTSPERTILISAIVLVVDAIIPWWYRIATPTGAYHYNAGLTGYGVLAFVAGLVAALIVIARASIWPEPAPTSDSIVYAVLGFIVTASILIQLAQERTGWIGAWIGLAAGLGIIVGAIRRRTRRRAGWQ